MVKFRYKMQNILDIKLKIEDQEKLHYSEARANLTEEEEKLTLLEHRKAAYERELREIVQTRIDLLEIKRLENAVENLKYFIKLQILEVKKAEKALEVARIRLNKAMMERKTHEKLKDKAWDTYLIDMSSEERKEVDQLVSFQYNNPTGYEEDN